MLKLTAVATVLNVFTNTAAATPAPTTPPGLSTSGAKVRTTPTAPLTTTRR
jgi:hypothetical protein